MNPPLRNRCLPSLSLLMALVLVATCPSPAAADILDTILDKVNDAITAASQAKTAAVAVHNNLKAGLADITGEMQTLIEQAAEEARLILEEEKEGLDEFLPGGQCGTTCSEFRADLVALLTTVDALTGAAFDVAELEARPDLSGLIGAVQSAPGRMLFPIYRTSSALLASDLPDRLAVGLTHLAVLRNAVVSAPATLPDQCTLMLSQSEAVERASYGVTGVAAVTKLLSMVFKALGRTEFEGYAAGWGFVGGTIKSNKRMQIGDVLSGISDVLNKVSGYAHNKLRYCATLEFQNETRTSLNAIALSLSALDLDTANLDAPISSRATQASVDGLRDSFQGMQAEMAKLVNLQSGAIAGGQRGSIGLRLPVERELAGKGPAMSVLYLPEFLGGLLEFVREVVEETIIEHQAAGYGVGDAWGLLSQGDMASAASQYRRSYEWYQAAYKLVTVDRPEQTR